MTCKSVTHIVTIGVGIGLWLTAASSYEEVSTPLGMILFLALARVADLGGDGTTSAF